MVDVRGLTINDGCDLNGLHGIALGRDEVWPGRPSLEAYFYSDSYSYSYSYCSSSYSYSNSCRTFTPGKRDGTS